MKVHVAGKVSSGVYQGGHTSHTGQMFFSDAITDRVARIAPYRSRGITRQRNATDQIYTGQGGRSSIVRLTPVKRGTAAKGDYGTITLGIDPGDTPGAVGR